MTINSEEMLLIAEGLGMEQDEIKWTDTDYECPECGNKREIERMEPLRVALNEDPFQYSDDVFEIPIEYRNWTGEWVDGTLADMIVCRLGYDVC